MRRLAVAAWLLLLVDAAGVAAIAVDGLTGGDPLGRTIALDTAELAALPLAWLVAGVGLSTWRRSRVGLWICLALALSPIILVLCLWARRLA